MLLSSPEQVAVAYLSKVDAQFPDENVLKNNGCVLLEVNVNPDLPSEWIVYNTLTFEFLVYDAEAGQNLLAHFATYEELCHYFSNQFDYESSDSLEQAEIVAWTSFSGQVPTQEDWRTHSLNNPLMLTFTTVSGAYISWDFYFDALKKLYVTVFETTDGGGIHAATSSIHYELWPMLRNEFRDKWMK